MITQPTTKLFQPATAWLPILVIAFFTAFCVLLGLGSVLRFGYPVGCFLVGIYLFSRHPILYIGFTWWIWFLSPLVRRLLDYQAGWVDPSLILVAPFLVALVSLLTFVRELPKAIQGYGLPFVLCMAGIIYGFVVGLVRLPEPTSVVLALLNWMTPVIFGYYLFANWRRFPEIRQVTQRVFLWGSLVMGSYGVVQFLIAPVWDRFWLENVISKSGNFAFGTPEPLQMRVFSTMHSHQPFACVMVAGVLLLLSSQNPLKLMSSGAGYLALLLTLARAAWMSWIIGIVVFLPSLKPKFQMRLIVTLMSLLILILPLTTIEPFSQVINSRVQSFFAGKQDGSYIDRSMGYTNLLNDAMTEFQGRGIGYVLRDPRLGSNDSGVLTLLLSLGWLGTIPYLGGLLLVIGSILRGQEASFDPFASACRAIAIATFSQISLNTAMLAAFGMILWSFIGLAMAARVYYLQVGSGARDIRG
jgi:hypothetical protein